MNTKFTGTYFGKVGNDISSCNQDLACALRMADLNFDVATEAVKDIRGNIIPRTQNIARIDTGESLGVMGAGYKPTQPRDAFKYLTGLPGGVNFQRGGMLKEGRFFLSAEFDTFEAAAGDSMTAFGVFLSSFDGTWSNRIVWVLGRHSCTNICRFEIGSASMNGKAAGRAAKHTLNHELKLDRFIVDLHMAQANLETEVAKLTKVEVTPLALENLIKRVVPNDSTKSETIRESIAGYFDRPDMGMNGKTLWDAYNAFSAYDTHAATRRATAVATTEENAFAALIAGRGYADRALPFLLELV